MFSGCRFGPLCRRVYWRVLSSAEAKKPRDTVQPRWRCSGDIFFGSVRVILLRSVRGTDMRCSAGHTCGQCTFVRTMGALYATADAGSCATLPRGRLRSSPSIPGRGDLRCCSAGQVFERVQGPLREAILGAIQSHREGWSAATERDFLVVEGRWVRCVAAGASWYPHRVIS